VVRRSGLARSLQSAGALALDQPHVRPGYWFWLIPLASNAHSLGIVCDAKMHPLDTMNTHAKAMDWLRTHQPGVAQSVDKPEHALQDFLFFRHFSYGCKQVFSGDRWALTGEAGCSSIRSIRRAATSSR
jgi:flavin-dependent dehydrogenase